MREQKAKEYLSTIYMLASYGAVRGAYIAREMTLSRPTVSVALQELKKAGYVIIDEEHLIHLTEQGERKAKESICETVDRGSDLSIFARQIQGKGERLPENLKKRKEEQLLRLLAKDQSTRVLEAILILSKHYYSVRIIDISQFIGQNSASVRTMLARLEKYGLVNRGEETTVTLTENGRILAEQVYQQHERIRNELMQTGLELFDAERKALSQL